MDRQVLTIWIAGLMIGSGTGLIIARSLPGPVHTNQTSAHSNHHKPVGEAGIKNSFYPDFLADPQQFPPLQSPETEQVGETLPVKSRETNREMPEPRLLPEGEAMPVQPQENQEDVMKKPTSSEFQSDLKKIAPELSEKALNDLAKIRSQIENDQE